MYNSTKKAELYLCNSYGLWKAAHAIAQNFKRHLKANADCHANYGLF